MTLEFETLSEFFDDFAQSVQIGTPPVTIQAIFDRAAFDAGMGESRTDFDSSPVLSVNSTQPFMTCRTEDVEGYARGAAVVVAGATYELRHQEPDGTGVSIVYLWRERS